MIDQPIGRHPVERKKMAVTASGREAQTRWTLKEELRLGFVLELSLLTGRTHQIRVHLKNQSAPIFGDPLYGPSLKSLPLEISRAVKQLGRQALHASKLSFLHPQTGEQVHFSSEVPADIRNLITALSAK